MCFWTCLETMFIVMQLFKVVFLATTLFLFVQYFLMKSLQGKHIVAEVFSVTFQKTSTTTSTINHEGFSRGLNGCSMYLKNMAG